MEVAKITSKGQITIPIDIRRKLGVKEGDKVLFVEDQGRIVMMNSSMEALRKAQMVFTGEAEHLGLENEQDVAAMISELRREHRGGRDASNVGYQCAPLCNALSRYTDKSDDAVHL